MKRRFDCLYNLSRILACLFLLFFTVSLCAQHSKKILFVGNSYTYYWNLPSQIETMGKSKGDIIHCFQSTVGGSHWGHHWRSEKGLHTKELIEKLDFDGVVLQNSSMSPFKAWDSIFYYGNLFDKLLDSKNAKIYLFQTWAREWSAERQDSINLAYDLLADEMDATVVPIGEAWQLAIRLKPEIKLYDPDGSHPSGLGAYLTACVFYYVLTEESPIGLPSVLMTKGKDGEKVYLNKQTKEIALFCQQAALDTVNARKKAMSNE